MENPRPRLLYLITSDLSSVLLRGQLGYMVSRGYDVTVGTRSADAGTSTAFDEGVNVVAVPFSRRPHLVRDVLALVESIRLIRRQRPDIVNSSTPKAGLIGGIAARVTRVPTRVYVVRGLRFETASGARRTLLTLLERVAMRCATHVVFNSESLRAVAERAKLLPAATGLVLAEGSGNGVSTEQFGPVPSRDEARRSLSLHDDDVVVGFVGRLTREKGVDDLVAVFGNLASSRPNLRLLLVGSHEGRDSVDAETERTISSHPSIVHVPWTTRPAAAYAAMDVLAFPSYREGLPNVALEAQICGVPVVGYACTGTVDAVVDAVTGVLVGVGDRSALEAAVGALVDDPAERRRLGDAGAAWVRDRFAPERVWDELAHLYAGSRRTEPARP